MKRFWSLVFVLGAVFVLGLSAPANPTQFSGQATVVNANVLEIPIVLVDTGPLPAEGGAAEASLLEAEVPGLLTAEVLHASTVGQGNQSSAEASVAELNLTVGGNTISAGFLMARATAQCQGGNASVGGSSEIVNLVINGKEIKVSGQPNQTVELPNGQVVINEQQAFTDADFGDITVNALHVVVNAPDGSTIADVVISSAHADIMCAGAPPPGKDFVTGGGWITPTSRSKANFGVAGGTKPNNALWGHLSYIDHGTRMKVKGTGVTSYEITGPTSRRIKGTCEINGQGGFTYQVDVSDNGEPGRNDTFAISLSNGYKASGNLGGGNIQLHTP
jgi:hypothetical protein